MDEHDIDSYLVRNANTVGIHEPRYSGMTADEADEAKRLEARLNELRSRADERAEAVGMKPYELHRVNEIVNFIRAWDITPEELAEVITVARRRALADLLGRLDRKTHDYIIERAFADAGGVS